MKPKKIIYITGTRAEYGAMEHLLQQIHVNPNFELSIIATGMHLSEEFGNTITEIRKKNFKIFPIRIQPGDSEADMVRYLGKLLIRIVSIFEKVKPDIILITGDRNESLAGAIAGTHMNILVVHLSGGDITTGGHIDELTRHAISKYAHIHFPSSESSAKSLMKMGEEKSRIFTVGNPGIPMNYTISESEKHEILNKYNLDSKKPIIIVLQHPCSSTENSEMQMVETMEAIKDLKYQTVLIYPNNDPGGRKMITVINQYRQLPFIRTLQNIPHEEFFRLMAVSSVIIGNSSCGLVEAPVFRLPAVNIGPRQDGRLRGNNVIDVPDHNRNQIKQAINNAISDTEFKRKMLNEVSLYAKENAEDEIIKILTSLTITKDLLRKNYLDALGRN